MKVLTRNIDKLSKQLSKSVRSHAESAATLGEESKRIAKASRTHAKQVKNLKKLRRVSKRGENLTKLANMRKQEKKDALTKEFISNHRRLDHLSPMQRYNSYNKTLSALSPINQQRFNTMYTSRHGRLPTKREALLDEKEIRELEKIELKL